VSDVRLILGDCLEVLPTLPDSSINLIVTDPPYYKVKGDWWDRQWDTPTAFLAWLDKVLAEFYRVLAPNGSLYLFASPRMAARVECLVGERFNVLNRITWAKPPYSTKAEMFRKGDLRMFFPSSEAIIFAEHHGADGYAKGESAKCDELRGFVFEPLRAYIKAEWQRAGLDRQDMNKAVGSSLSGGGMASHYIGDTGQWSLPTAEHYQSLREYADANDHGGEYLRRDYEYLRREYEDLRRPFSVSAEVPYTDVWTFPTINAYPGKHPCEKPLAMMEHIVTASSRPGDVVLDSFCGSGNSGIAAHKHGRDYVGIDIGAHWVETAERRIAEAQLQLRMPLEVAAI